PRFPGLIVGARLGSPLVVGLGEDQTFLASDPAALVGYTQRVVYLSDHQLCALTPQKWDVLNGEQANGEQGSVSATVHSLDGAPVDSDKGDYEHFMLKEIHEQPEVVERAMAGRLNAAEATAHFGGLNLEAQQLRQIDRVIMTA